MPSITTLVHMYYDKCLIKLCHVMLCLSNGRNTKIGLHTILENRHFGLVPRWCFFCGSFLLVMLHVGVCCAVVYVPCSLVTLVNVYIDLLVFTRIAGTS